MNTIKLASCFIYITIYFSLISCTSDEKEKNVWLKNCYIFYKISDFDSTTNYYRKNIPEKSAYIAFKEFSNFNTRLVSLVNTGDKYILSVSVPVFKKSTVSKIIPVEKAKNIFNKFNTVSILDGLNGGDAFHPECIIVKNKTADKNSIAYLYNPFIDPYRKIDYENTGLRMYAVLSSLVSEYIPDYTDQIISLNSNDLQYVQIENRTFTLDTYTDASKNETQALKRQLLDNPFFEISTFQNSHN